jgi:Tol biopolymer transport system component/DNA-binding winged helix-turn-helix (wHTH) protein
VLNFHVIQKSDPGFGVPIEETNPASHVLRFSSFELDLRAGELRKHGTRIKLQGQPLQVLALLIENPGDVVTREQLRERLWPADTFVDFDHSLNSAVKKLRQALNDDPDVPRFIETLPRRGYRFIAPVGNSASLPSQAQSGELGNSREGSAAGPSSDEVAHWPSIAPATARLHHWKLWAAGGFGFALALGIAAWFGLRPTSAPNLSPIRLVPLTTLSNGGSKPSFSPDGNQIAYSWGGENKDGVDIYIKQIGVEKPLQLTSDFGYNFYPAWSPDGRYIAFSHANRKERPGIYLLPAVGGTPRKLIELPNAESCKPSSSWSPDGKFLLFSDKIPSTPTCAVYQLGLDDLKAHQITSPPSPSTGDASATYSPDGSTLAFVRNTKEVDEIYLMPAYGGEPRRLTFDNRLILGLTWTPDSKELVFASNRGGSNFGLWRIPASGGTPERLVVGSDGVFGPAISLKGHRLAYGSGFWNENIWRTPVGPGHRGGKPERLLSSDTQEEGPQYSPDGQHIAFQSTRSGSFEIWRADANGMNLVQLTSFGGPLTGTPRWSPDGKQICFDSRPGPHANIHIIGADGGPVRRLINDSSDDAVASWSRDGRWLYFASNRGGSWQVWKRTVEGGAPVQITRNGGFAPLASTNGKLIYYTKFDAPGVFQVPIDGGNEVKILDEPPSGYWGYVAVGPDGVYFAGDVGAGKQQAGFKFYDPVTRKITNIGSLDKQAYEGAPGLSISPDGRFLLDMQLDESRDSLMLAENFR